MQLVVMNRLKNNEATRSAKSLGDSIKKHIFHKSLMSRTPKRVPPSFHMAGGAEVCILTFIQILCLLTNRMFLIIHLKTPNMSHVKQPKLRVLFQSPTPPTPTATISSTITSVTLATNPLHQLPKSISSASLKIESSLSSSDSSSSCAPTGSISAPVSRQQSKEGGGEPILAGQELDEIDTDCCVTPLKIMSAAARLIEKKTVAWDDHRLLAVEEYSNPSTPVQQSSRYKSEPNLSSLLPQVHATEEEDDDDGALTPIVEAASSIPASSHHLGRSITRKLMKGVSMGNLRFPFSTPETTKRLVRSVSATLRRRPSGDAETKHQAPLLEDVDDSDVEEDHDNDEEDDDTLSENNGSSNELPPMSMGYQQILQSSVYRNMDLITSTPALHLGRRSMSPITKSTQRMPKAMQVRKIYLYSGLSYSYFASFRNQS